MERHATHLVYEGLASLVEDLRVTRAIEMISRVETPPASAQSVAELLDLSVSRLQHIFKSELGISVTSFRLALRMHRAALLLRSVAPVKRVQFEGGFADAANFAHQFKRHFGLSASRFQINAREDKHLRIGCLCSEKVRQIVELCAPSGIDLLADRANRFVL